MSNRNGIKQTKPVSSTTNFWTDFEDFEKLLLSSVKFLSNYGGGGPKNIHVSKLPEPESKMFVYVTVKAL